MWTIKDVARLTGVSRDDIHSVCEKGKKASFIFCPEDSRPGRRYFMVEDIKKIWLIGRYKEMGYKLPEIAKIFREAEEEGQGFAEQISAQIDELESRRRQLDRQIALAERMRRYAQASPDSDSALMALLCRDASTSLLDAIAALLADLDCPLDIDEFTAAFRSAYGMSIEGLVDNWFLTKEGDGEVEWEYVEVLEGLLSRGWDEIDPESAEVYSAIDSLLGLIARGVSLGEGDTDIKLGWLFINKFLDTPENELLIAVAMGDGAHAWMRESLKSYARRKWGGDSDGE